MSVVAPDRSLRLTRPPVTPIDGQASQTRMKVEGTVEKALEAVQLIFYLMGGLGLFFLGIGVLSFVDVYKKKNG